jgi:hypothetical protein
MTEDRLAPPSFDPADAAAPAAPSAPTRSPSWSPATA